MTNKVKNEKGFIGIVVTLVVAAVVVGTGIYIYNRTVSPILSEPKKSPGQIVGSEAPRGSRQSPICEKIAPESDVRKIFGENIVAENASPEIESQAKEALRQALPPEDDARYGGLIQGTTICNYRSYTYYPNGNIKDRAGVNAVIYHMTDIFQSALEQSQGFSKIPGSGIEQVQVGSLGFYDAMRKTLGFENGNKQFYIGLEFDGLGAEKFTREQLIALAQLVNKNLK